jgi:archaellum component FlaF (FlaF/FlaG flagellin family)
LKAVVILISILWILALSYTAWKRGRQLKKIENRLKSYIDEQEKTERKKSKKAAKKGNDTKDPSERSG